MPLQRVLEIYIQDLEEFGILEAEDPRIERIKAAYQARIDALKQAKGRLEEQIEKLKQIKNQIETGTPEGTEKKAEILKDIATLMERLSRVDSRINSLRKLMQTAIERLA